MSDFCPVCKNAINDDTVKCSACGFTDLHREFITKEDAQEWFDTIVLPYRNQWEKQQIEKNIEIVCPVCKETLTKADKKCKNCGFAELNMEFINKEDGELWLKQVVEPYKKKYEIEKYEKDGFVIENGELKKYTKSESIITIPSIVHTIGISAFHNNQFVEEIIMNDGITKINANSFNCCSNLQVVKFSSDLEYIGDKAFYFSKLRQVEFPQSLKIIGDRAFCHAFGVKGLRDENINIYIPKNVEYIGEDAFDDIDSVIVDENNINYASKDGVLYNKDISTLIKYYGKENIKENTKYSIPNSVVSILYGAFYGSHELIEINIPDSVENIDENFNGCGGLENINVDEKNNNYASVDGGLYNKSLTDLIRCPRGKIGKYTVAEGTVNINSFYSCIELTQVILPNSVEKIKWSAFEGCRELESINLPNNLKEIGENAFKWCRKMNAVEVPGSVETIEKSTFANCKSLKDIKLNNGLLRIETGAFTGCESLEKIIIPDTVCDFGYSTFCDCAELKNVELSNSITEIGKYVFKGCTSLKEINIPHNVTYIKNNAFEGCKNLTKIVIPKNVERIDNNVFLSCKKLTIHCEQHSYAHKYATEHNIPVQFID